MTTPRPTVLLLLSGGYDSPVAGHVLRQGGFDVLGVHFSQEPFTDNSPERKALLLAQKLGIQPVYVINVGMQLLEFSTHAKESYYFVLQKRLFYRLATTLAHRLGIQFIATGESVAQVSSQTLVNLTTLDQALTDVTLLRPLLGYNKQEIIDLAKKIGTYDTSTGPESCDKLGPKRPVINSLLENVLTEEEKFDIDGMVMESLATSVIHEPLEGSVLS